jgi:hypothetical protein
MLLDASNFVNIAGELHVRSGMVGMFGGNAPSSSSSSSHSGSSSSSSSSATYIDIGPARYAVPSAASYQLVDFDDGLGSTWMLFASGGKLYKSEQGADHYFELLNEFGFSYALNSPVVDAQRIGDFAYLVDAAHAMFRVSLNGGFPAYAMQAPTLAPTVSLTDVTIDTPAAAQWLTGPTPINFNSLISNGYFDVGGGVVTDHTLPGAPWTVQDGPYVIPATSPDYGPGSSSGVSQQHIPGHNFSLLLNEVSNAVGQQFRPPYNQATIWPDPSPLLKNACFLFTCQILLQAPGSNASLSVTVQAYNSVGGLITQQTQILNPTNTATWSQVSAAFNFTTSFTTDPSYYQLILASGPNNTSTNGVWVAACTLNPLQDGPQISDSGGGQVRWTAPYAEIGASYIVRNYGSGKNFSAVGALGFAISSTSVPLADLYLRFGFVATPTSSSSSSSSSSSGVSSSSSSSGYPFNGPGAIEWSNNIKFNSEGTFGYADITTIDPSILASVEFLFIQVVLDLPSGDVNPGTPTNILTFGPLTASGELSIGSEYLYYITESTRIDAANIIESNPSPPSVGVTTTIEQAEFDIVAAAPVNPSTNYLTLWRLGGPWTDVRQIAMVPLNADVAFGNDPLNPNYSWNHTTRTFLDNTPDTALSLANLLSFGRFPMPSNAQAVALYNGRLFAAVGNQVYISWLFDGNNSQPLYTTLVQTFILDPQTDTLVPGPNTAIEGATFPISPDPSDTVVRMVPYGTPVAAGQAFGGGLVVYCKRSVWLIQGTNALNFELQQYPYTKDVGLVAFRGVTRLDSNLMAFLGPDRIHMFPPTQDSPEQDRGLHIQPQIYPVRPQTLMNSVAFSTAWLHFHDQKILMGCPVPGGTQNSVVWIYDLRIGGWTRWTGPASGGAFPQPGMAITGAMTLPPTNQGASYDLYLFGIDGQIYRMEGTVDQYTRLSATQAIPFTVTAHALRPSFYVRYKARPLLYMWARLERFEVEMIMNGTLTMTSQAYEVGTSAPVPIAGKTAVASYELVGGGRTFRQSVPPGLIEGVYITVTLSGAVTDAAYLRGLRGWISGTTYEQAG